MTPHPRPDPTATTRVRRPLALRLAVPLVTAACALLGIEAAARWLDGHQWLSLRLQPRSEPPGEYRSKLQRPAEVAEHVARIPTAPGVDRRWFAFQIPAVERKPADPELAARAAQYPGRVLQATYEWNRAYVERTLCNDARRRQAVFDQLDDVYVFESPDGGEFPSYRFHRNASYPSGLQTNAFGWRGSRIDLDKPPGTIRIAFLGASTTAAGHGDPFSYPELVEVWLNLWAVATGRSVRFEVLNTAREGTTLNTMRAIVQHELLPLEPDLVVFYEGSNHFWPADFIDEELPPRPLTQVADDPGVLARHSALAARIRNLFLRGPVVGEEPDKPALVVRWPADLSEDEPDVSDHRLPTNLANVLAHLQDIDDALDATGARLALSSFTWLVEDGMRLDPRRDAGIFRYLNEAFWPFSYAHMRRYADFQNRVFRRFAERHGLDFIDYDAQFPRDPRLFYDAIHLSDAGTRLQAWVMLQGLVPLIDARLASGEWPRPDRVPQTSHPAFTAERRLVPVRELASACDVRAH